MSNYIERRPEVIEAIKKSLRPGGKWYVITMGCVPESYTCELCIVQDTCEGCALTNIGQSCALKDSAYKKWVRSAKLVTCSACRYNGISCGNERCSRKPAPAEAEAMYEVLVNLLPTEDREEFGG